MNIEMIRQLVKEALSIKSEVMDFYLTQIINGVIKELEDEKGLNLDGDNLYHLLFVVDYFELSYKKKMEQVCLGIYKLGS